MILDETRERFIKAIVKQVDPARIAEIHFFAPIRQGGVESGVAVIAAAEPAPEPIATLAEQRHPEDAALGAVSEGPLVAEEESPGSDVVEDSSSAHRGPSEAAPPQDDESVAEAAPPQDDADEDGARFDHARSDDVEPASTPIERHVIYTARYRLTLKGVDRGKWETNVTAEADAPIITVDAVVRGVQRRSGDVDDATRMSGDDIRAAIPAPV